MFGFGKWIMSISPTFKMTGIKTYPMQVKKAVQRASIAPEMKAGFLVEREAKKLMQRGGRTGIGQKRGIPSAPGTPPHRQLGELVLSIATARDGQSVIVGPTVPYGKVHEQPGNDGEWAGFGGRNYPKRAFMRPALLNVMKKFAKFWKSLNLK